MRVLKAFVLMLMALISVPSSGTNFKFSEIQDDSLKIIEKVYVHTDRSAYYPTDNIWFKAYIVDASDKILSDYSKNLHVELISPASKIIDSRIARIDGGQAKGDFRLPDKLESGSYILRAYTNYMRNFGEALFFNKTLTIINPADSIKTVPEVNNYKKKKLEISFFPEGGSLVDGVPSIVAFKVTDVSGRAHDVRGEIFSSTGEFVTAFKSSHKGMGDFLLTPVSGTRYAAIAGNSNGDTAIGEVPRSFPTGITLNVSGNRNKELLITIRTNSETLPSLLNEDLTIEISARSRLYKKAAFRMKSQADRFTLPVNDLTDGIYLITLTSADKKPVCERMVFIRNSNEVNLNVETNKTDYNRRDSVSVCLTLEDNGGNSGAAYLSISAGEDIFNENSSDFPETISSWFLLESDIRGEVEDPSYYFDPSNKNRLKDLDLLLLTQGWRDFEWKYKNLMYPPERGFTISGRVRRTLTDKPLENALVNIGIFKTGNPVVKLIPTDSSGRFFLDGIDFTGKAKVIVSTVDEKDRLKGLVILDSLLHPHAEVPEILSQPEFTRNDTLNVMYQPEKNKVRYIQYGEITTSVARKYKLSDTIKPGEVNIIARRIDAPESARARSRRYLMSTPDREIIITEMEEKYNNTFQFIDFRLLAPISTKMPSGAGHRLVSPLYLIDGVYATEDELRMLPVDWVERIDVATNEAALAPFKLVSIGMSFAPLPKESANDMAKLGLGGRRSSGGQIDGVISIMTRNGNNVKAKPVFYSANIQISGYDEPRVFYSPKHHTTLEKDYKPDFRATLFWNPDIEMGDTKKCFLNFYNDDNSGKIRVIVEGITSTGIPVTGNAVYEVK